MITEDAVGVKHVRDLIIYVELPVSDGQRQVERSGWERRRISRIIHNVEAGKTHPHVATGNVHAVIVVKMHRPALMHPIFETSVCVVPRSSRCDEEIHWLSIVLCRRVIAVIMRCHLARGWIEVIRESHVSSLPGRPANC